MTEYEKAEQEVAAAKVAERIAEWKAMEAKSAYYRYASDAMAASAEVMGARIRRDNALASEFVEKAQAAALTPAPEAEPGSDALEIPEGFTKWEGGECPVAEGVARFEVLQRSGIVCEHIGNDATRAQAYWAHINDPHDIIAYRIISEPAGEGETAVTYSASLGEATVGIVNYEPAPLIIADPSSVEELGEQSEPYSAAHEAEEPLTLDQLDEAGITDPDASAMLRMMTARKLEGVS